MIINVGKFVIIMVYLCVLVAADGLYLQEYIQALAAKVNNLFVGKQFRDEDDKKPQVWNLEPPADGPIVNQCNKDEILSDWWSIKNNWWIIVVSSLIPFVVFYTIQLVNGPPEDEDPNFGWTEPLIPRDKKYTHNRRLTLPDLTLARHARRESLAENAQSMPNRPRKMSQCITKFRKIRKNSFERNDESLGETKRAHIIRRRH